MKARLSVRSRRLSRVSWTFFVLTFLVSPLLSILGVPRFEVDQHDPVFWLVGLLAVGLWPGVLVAYVVSRLNDAWDEEARERRARRRAARDGVAALGSERH
jgi:peptidoglycan/LPS O-acetylase OafA/YrhL